MMMATCRGSDALASGLRWAVWELIAGVASYRSRRAGQNQTPAHNRMSKMRRPKKEAQDENGDSRAIQWISLNRHMAELTTISKDKSQQNHGRTES